MSHDAMPPVRRLATGSRELDEILEGGISENSINIIMGAPGSGKTTLAEEFIFANADDERRPILYFTTLSEPLDKVETWPPPPPIMASDESHGRLSHMTDNIVFLGVRTHGGIVGRTLRIAKARGAAHDLQERKMKIDARGLRIVKARG